MCLTCGCLFGSKGNKLRFKVEGYTKYSSSNIKKELLGLPGVYAVHIHLKDGETSINYDQSKISLNDILNIFKKYDLNTLL